MSYCLGALHGKPLYVGSIIEHDDWGLKMVRGVAYEFNGLYACHDDPYYLFFHLEDQVAHAAKMAWPDRIVDPIECFDSEFGV